MTCYNNEAYVEKAVRSILNQTIGNIEIIAIDDASSDRTGDILKGLANADNRMRVIRNTSNLGVGASLNRIIPLAKADYIARMDGDDLSLPDRLERQLRFLKQKGIGMCGTWVKTMGSLRNRKMCFPENDEEIRVYMLFQSPFMHPSVMLRAELLKEKCQYRPEAGFAEDYDLWSRLSVHTKMMNLPKVLYRYRIHPGQVSNVKAMNQWINAVNIRISYLNICRIPATKSERRLHGKIRFPIPPESREEVLRMEQWLRKLVSLYKGRQKLQRIIADQWFRVCLRSASYGPWAWLTFMDSPLQIVLRPTLRQELDLLFLSLFRIRYQSRLYGILEQLSLS